MSDTALETAQEDQTLEVSSVEHPQDKSYKMFLPTRTKPRKRKTRRAGGHSTERPFELSDDWKFKFDIQPQNRCNDALAVVRVPVMVRVPARCMLELEHELAWARLPRSKVIKSTKNK